MNFAGPMSRVAGATLARHRVGRGRRRVGQVWIDRDGEYEVRPRPLLEVIGTVDSCVTSVLPMQGGMLAAAYGASGVYFLPIR